MRRRIEARVFKLEAKRRQRTGLFFLAWGRNENEAVAIVDRLKADGKLNDGDVVVAGTWPHAGPMPASRWIKTGELSRQERDALDDEIERFHRHFLADKYDQTLREDDGHDSFARWLSDEELIAELWRFRLHVSGASQQALAT
jgi:hypothetical protein